MPGISFGGLASGLDTDAIVSALMKVERRPLDVLNTRQGQLSAARNTINQISTRLGTLSTAAKALSTTDGFTSTTASSSDPAIVANASGGASPGAYDVKVLALAREQRTYSTAFASEVDDLSITGTLDLSVAGTSASLTIDPEDSLAEIATKINGAGLRVSASVISTTSGMKLQIRGLDTGAANAVTFGGTAASALGLDDPSATFQGAQDARIEVDGNTITRPTNQITSVIPGVTLALTKESASPITVRVSSDPTSLKSKIQAFVNAYNDVVSSGQGAIGFGSTTPQNKELAGDSSIRTVLDRISSLVASPVEGTTGRYTTLASVGISLSREGRLSFDETKFNAALASDATAVARVFVKDPLAASSGIMSSFVDRTAELSSNTDALLRNRLDSIDRLARRLTKESDDLNERLARTETQLRSRFSQLELAVAKYKSLGNAVGGLERKSST
jgi:flagellar hook-associated protein 2